MKAARPWRDRLGRLAIAIFGTDVLVYVGRLLLHRQFYEDHYNAMVICAEAGFVLSITAIILALIGIHARRTIPIVVLSLALTYLWFSDIAFWVMVK